MGQIERLKAEIDLMLEQLEAKVAALGKRRDGQCFGVPRPGAQNSVERIGADFFSAK